MRDPTILESARTAEDLDAVETEAPMLPLSGVLGLEAWDLIGYGARQFFIHLPVMPLLAALMMTTFTYRPPMLP